MNQNWHYIFPKKLLLRAYSTFKHSLSTTKVNYSRKMKISLCILINTLSLRVKTNPQHIKYRYRTHVSRCEILILKLRQ